MSTERRSHIFIRELDPKKTPWTLKVKVIRRGGSETYETRYGLVDIMKLILMDEEGAKIQATLKNQEIACLSSIMEKDKAYLIENGTINEVKTTFLNAHDKFEIILSPSTIVTECTDVFVMPRRVYNFLDYEKLEDAKDVVKDIIGVVLRVRQPIPLKVGKKTKRDANKRDITLSNGRSNTTTIGLWGDLADNEGELPLSTTYIRTIEINPEIMETEELKKSYNKNFTGKDVLQLLYPTKRMRDAVSADLRSIFSGNIDAPFYTFKAKIDRVLNREHPWYENCKACNSRVYPGTTDDTAVCTQCDNKNVAFVRRAMLRIVVSNGANEAYVTLFDALETILGCPLLQYIEYTKKCESKEGSRYYKNLFTCLGEEYTFLVKLDQKNAVDRSRKYIIA